jgi:chlorophyll synthase
MATKPADTAMSRPATSVVTSEIPAPGVVLELLKPITWFPPMWAFGCGAVSSGVALRAFAVRHQPSRQ